MTIVSRVCHTALLMDLEPRAFVDSWISSLPVTVKVVSGPNTLKFDEVVVAVDVHHTAIVIPSERRPGQEMSFKNLRPFGQCRPFFSS